MNNWLFDGEGIEWSDLARAESLQNEREMLSKLGKSGVSQNTPRKLVTDSQCPHCGGQLPANAKSKRYEFCLHCSNRLLWQQTDTQVSCPHCSNVNTIMEDRFGKLVKCLACQREYIAGSQQQTRNKTKTSSKSRKRLLVRNSVLLIGVVLLALMVSGNVNNAGAILFWGFMGLVCATAAVLLIFGVFHRKLSND